MPAVASAWPLVALDAFHPVADDTPRPTAGVLPLGAGVLPRVAPVLDDTPPVLDDTLPGVAPVLDDTLSSADVPSPAAKRSVP